MKISAMMMGFCLSWIWQMMLDPCISTRSVRKQNMKDLVRDWLARLSISPFSPKPCKSLELTHVDREMLNLLSSDGILPHKLYRGSALFLWSCGSRLMMEWALLSRKMRKLLELVPDVQCPMCDRGLLFISTSDPDAFTLLGWLFRVCHVHKSPALGDLVSLRKIPWNS